MIGLVDIGGTKLLAAVTNEQGLPGARRRQASQGEYPLERIVAMLDELRHGEPLRALALGVPGPFDRETGELVGLPGMSEAWHGGWRGVRLVASLGERFGCPVYVENDANCAALGEAHFGAGRGFRTVVYYSIATGVGGGVVRDGVLYVGRHDNELGHQIVWPAELGGPPCSCGSTGCLEAVVGGEALQRRYQRPGEELDEPAVWEEVGRWLGQAVINTTALFDPDLIVFGGGVCARWPAFAPSMFAAVTAGLRLLPPPGIQRAQLGEDRGLWGALTLVPAELRGRLP